MATTKQPAQSVHTQEKTKQSDASQSQSKGSKPSGYATIADIVDLRGLSEETIASLGWRAGQDGFIEIPTIKGGKEVNIKFRTFGSEKKFYQSGGEQCFYNYDAISEADKAGEQLIITEGEVDCATALQCGYLAVSVPNGAPSQEVGDKESKQYNYLEAIPKSLRQIVLCTDDDAPGQNLMNDLALRLGKHRCKFVKYPQGCKDLNETLLKYGQKGVDETIKRAQYTKVSGVYKMSELPPIQEPETKSGQIGIDLSFRKGDFSVLTGIPSHGKSTFANTIAYNLSKQGWRTCFASLEQQPQTDHKWALSGLYNQKPPHLLTRDEIKEAEQWIDKNFVFLVPDDSLEDFDLEWLKDAMATAVFRHGVDVIIVDPWNELDHIFDARKESMTQYVGRAIKTLKRFAKEYNIHLMVVAHPAKMQKNTKGEYPVPSAYDISDSAHWYNKPDQIFVIHRQEDGTLFRYAKSRYHTKLGKPGDYRLEYDDYKGIIQGFMD
jgi:twinkle protein